jgi:MarR family transcriptional regulator, organic hydroperoxide resistance regulator
MSGIAPPSSDRVALERLIGADLREMTSEADWITRVFAAQNNITGNDFRALLFVMMAETAGTQLTAGELRRQMGLSGAAITYLVERMTDTGHIRREADPKDRRKVILRYADHGLQVALAFFQKLAEHNHDALAHLPDSDLRAAHRTFSALATAMHEFRVELPESSSPNGQADS